MTQIKIPVYKPSLSGNEGKYVQECIDSTWISSKGKYVSLFEEGFASYTGAAYATAVCNGTVAIHLALLALGIGPGDEVIVPTLTYIASVNAIVYTGATPVFAESERESWQLDVASVKEKITPRTKAVMAVHLYGQSCDMNQLSIICKQHNLYLIEDCAEAIGSRFQGHHVGTFGDIATFSFFGNKTITTGEGGMVVSNHKSIMDRCIHLKGQGLAKDRQYWHDIIGYNYRMTNICAAIGLAQLEQIDSFTERKIQIASTYRRAFESMNNITFHNEMPGTKHSYWMCSVLVRDAADREPLRDFLAKKGIETRPLFFPAHTMPMYSGQLFDFPVANDLASRGINLPSYPSLKEEEINEVVDAITAYYQ